MRAAPCPGRSQAIGSDGRPRSEPITLQSSERCLSSLNQETLGAGPALAPISAVVGRSF